MKKLTPINLGSNEELNSQLGQQEVVRSTPLSRDPENYPVFKSPVNKKVLIYVPNHIIQTEDGKDELRMDTPLIHIIQKKNRFEYYRCISGLHSDAAGYDGTCPLCDGSNDSWTLANYQIEDSCKSKGLATDDDDDSVKAIKSKFYSNRVVQDAERYYTFPIVVFDTVNDEAKQFIKDEQGNISYKIMWYSISERGYEKKWAKALENMEEEPTNPGGLFLVLDYTYTPKKGEPNARDSAREMSIYPKKFKASESLKPILDAATEGWTPEKARETVIRNNLYSYADLEEVTDDALEATRNLIALFESRNADGIEKSEDVGFNLDKKEDQPTGSVVMDATDEDVDDDMGIPME